MRNDEAPPNIGRRTDGAADSVRMGPKAVSCLERRINDPLLRAHVLKLWKSPTFPQQKSTTTSQWEGLYLRRKCISRMCVAEGSVCLSVDNGTTEIQKITEPVWDLCFPYPPSVSVWLQQYFENERGTNDFQRSKNIFWVTSGPRKRAEPRSRAKIQGGPRYGPRYSLQGKWDKSSQSRPIWMKF